MITCPFVSRLRALRLILLIALSVLAATPAPRLLHAGSASLPAGQVLSLAAPTPDPGVNSIQRIQFTAQTTSGTFKLKFGSSSTQAISFSDEESTLAANVQTKLNLLSSIGANGVSCQGDINETGPRVDCTFAGPKVSTLAVATLTAPTNSLVGDPHTIAVSVLTPGVTADGRNAKPGALLLTSTGAQFVNNGNVGHPDWQPVATGETGPITTITTLTGPISTTSGNPLNLTSTAPAATTGATSSLGTVTITAADPAVITLAAHGLTNGDQVRFTTTGTLPSPLVAGTWYFVEDPATDTFKLTVRPGINILLSTSGASQSGTHTAHRQVGQTGIAATLTSSAAVPDASVIGAAAGGAALIKAGDAARNTSGNAPGGDVYLHTGNGLGTSRSGMVRTRADQAPTSAIPIGPLRIMPSLAGTLPSLEFFCADNSAGNYLHQTAPGNFVARMDFKGLTNRANSTNFAQRFGTTATSYYDPRAGFTESDTSSIYRWKMAPGGSNAPAPLITANATGELDFTIENFMILTPRARPPSLPGVVYVDDEDAHLYFYNGTDWKQLDPAD